MTAVAVSLPAFGGEWADSHAVDAGLEQIEAALLRLREDLPVETRLVSGASVPHALHTLARDERAGMIVVGSTHRGRTGRVLPSSTAERLLHGAPCAVALAPHGDVRAPVDTIAVGFVDSPEGHAALAVGHMLAGQAGGGLRVIAALHPTAGWRRPRPRAHRRRAGSRSSAVTALSVDAALNAALNALPAGVEVEPELHVDDPADVLLRVSEHVGLLVCGSRGYGPLRSVLLGGVSRRLVDEAHCPVLVLPREAGRPLHDLVRTAPGAVAAAR